MNLADPYPITFPEHDPGETRLGGKALARIHFLDHMWHELISQLHERPITDVLADPIPK